ncbi:MAG: CRISPR system precrRNA processing endoribonuclease RAMP protein Cas6 [Bacillota bacterium]
MLDIPCPQRLVLIRYDIQLSAGPQGLSLPPYKGSTFRGGFAGTFQRLVCSTGSRKCRTCPVKAECPYALVFESEPPEGSEALRNYQSIPRPFILEPPLEDKTEYVPGELLVFRLSLFGRAANLLPYFVVTLDEFARRGIGKGRRPFDLDRITAVNPLTGEKAVIYEGTDRIVRPRDLSVTARDVWLYAAGETAGGDIGAARIRFVTPAHIKFEAHPVRVPEFHTLIRNLLRRISSMCYFHHGFAYEADFPAVIAAAEAVYITEDHTRWFDWERYSSRQAQKVPLGGIIGDASYKGPLSAFWPLLRLGELLHVGKGTVFGQGKIAVERF